jgi:putative transcriptional regulator
MTNAISTTTTITTTTLATEPLDIGAALLQSVREMKAGIRARVTKPALSEIAQARLATSFTQIELANVMGVSVRTLQDWEQGRRHPSGAAKTLLRVACKHPRIVREAALA